jgi:hypothetical protein
VVFEVGIGLPTLGTSDGSGDLDVVAAARQAEALGFDSVDAADLIAGDGTPALEAAVALATAAAVTKRIMIGFGALACRYARSSGLPHRSKRSSTSPATASCSVSVSVACRTRRSGGR